MTDTDHKMKIAPSYWRALASFIIFSLALTTALWAWTTHRDITLKMLGQPSSVGPIAYKLEEPFFSSLAARTQPSIKIDYRTLNEATYRDEAQLQMLKNNEFDMVSLRILQNQKYEPALESFDLIGLSDDYIQAQKIAKAQLPWVNKRLEQRFDIKILGMWPFGSQVFFCRKPISTLSDLKGLKVRIGGDVFIPLIESLGAIPVVTTFGDAVLFLADQAVDCAVASQASGLAASWGRYAKNVFPIAVQMGLNGIVIQLSAWNGLSIKQQQDLQTAVDQYVEDAWKFAQELEQKATTCFAANSTCSLGPSYQVQIVSVPKHDQDALKRFAMTVSVPQWFERCKAANLDCERQWKTVLLPLLQTSDKQF